MPCPASGCHIPRRHGALSGLGAIERRHRRIGFNHVQPAPSPRQRRPIQPLGVSRRRVVAVAQQLPIRHHLQPTDWELRGPTNHRRHAGVPSGEFVHLGYCACNPRVIKSSVALLRTDPSDIPSEPRAPKRSSVGIAEFPSILIDEIVGLSRTFM